MQSSTSIGPGEVAGVGKGNLQSLSIDHLFNTTTLMMYLMMILTSSWVHILTKYWTILVVTCAQFGQPINLSKSRRTLQPNEAEMQDGEDNKQIVNQE